MNGIELEPSSAFVVAGRSQLFQADAPTSGRIVGVLIGARERDVWRPAIARVAVELVAVAGVALQLWTKARSRDGIGWNVHGAMRVGQRLAVIVRNDLGRTTELRVVLAIDGAGGVTSPTALRRFPARHQ